VLQEYSKVKDEMLAAISAQHTTMTYALTAAAAIFAGLLSVWDDYVVRVAILSLGPLLIVFLWFIWLGELTRMARAARFLYEREKEINDLFQQRLGGTSLVLAWESWVRGSNRWSQNLHLGPSYVLSTFALYGMAVVSTAISLSFTAAVPTPPWLIVLAAFSAALVLFLAVLGVRTIRATPVLERGL
jgi:hypothetical protein